MKITFVSYSLSNIVNLVIIKKNIVNLFRLIISNATSLIMSNIVTQKKRHAVNSTSLPILIPSKKKHSHSLSLSLPLCLARMTRNEDIQEIDIDELPEDPWDEITLHLIHDSKIDLGTYYFSLSQSKLFFFISYFSPLFIPKILQMPTPKNVEERSARIGG